MDLDSTVKFVIDRELYQTYLSTPLLIKESSLNDDIIFRVENIVSIWKGQMETVIINVNISANYLNVCISIR